MTQKTESAPSVCPNCGTGEMTIFHRVEGVPVNSCILLDTREEALHYPKGEIHLGFCNHCGFISNTRFDPEMTEYSGRYEETQGFSATFRAFHEALAERLIDRHSLRDKQIIEIGCGKGEFLSMLCDLGGNQGVGFDPGVDEHRIADAAGAQNARFIADFYSEKYADYDADFYVCKMTLEHIHPTGRFIAMVRRAIGNRVGTGVFFQIPDATRILRDCAFEDIYYEHCSYFTPASLRRLFSANRFEVTHIGTEYADQYLTIEAKAVDGDSTPEMTVELQSLSNLVDEFGTCYSRKLDEWKGRMADYAARSCRVVLWGAGSKAVAFLSTLGSDSKIDYGVDINPYRQGHFLPGSGVMIVGPEFLSSYDPDVVIIMNAIYRDEISAELAGLGLHPEVLALE